MENRMKIQVRQISESEDPPSYSDYLKIKNEGFVHGWYI